MAFPDDNATTKTVAVPRPCPSTNPGQSAEFSTQVVSGAVLEEAKALAKQSSEPAPPPADGPPGYELIAELGRGAMGVVYLAEETALRRKVAVKLVRAEAAGKAHVLARAAVEARIVARFQHPNIVQIFHVGTWPETGPTAAPFLALEYVPGGTFAHTLAGTPQLPNQSAKWLVTIARAVHYAHEQGVIHRDLKPANILFTTDGQPKVSDFGLAKQLDAASSSVSGDIVGTPSYMSPEQAQGESSSIGPAADVWALGVILYECITGRPAFKAATMLDTFFQVIGSEPVAPRALVPTVPRDLETIALKCLRKPIPQRYATAAELADDLQRFLDGLPILARPVGPLGRARRWAFRNPLAAGLAAGLFVVLVGSLIGMGFLLREAVAGRTAAEVAQTRAERIDRQSSETEAAAQAVLNEFVIDELFPANEFPDAQAKRVRLKSLIGKARSRFKGQTLLLTSALNFLANAYNAIESGRPPAPDDFAAAEALYREVLALRTAEYGPEHPGTLQAGNNLAWHLSWNDPIDVAERRFRECYANGLRALGPDHSTTFTPQQNWVWALVEAERFADAEREARVCLAVRERVQGRDFPLVSHTRRTLADALMGLGGQAQVREARELYEYNRRIVLDQFGPDHPLAKEAIERWAGAELDAGNAAEVARDFEQVEPLLRTTYEGIRTNPKAPPGRVERACARLVKLYDAAGKADEANKLRNACP